MKYKVVKEYEFAGWKILCREWWNPFWRGPSSYHNPTYWTREDAEKEIEWMKERRKP